MSKRFTAKTFGFIRSKREANRRPPKRACAGDPSSLRSLDPSQIHLIFHCLSITDRLGFGAASRKLRFLADSPAAWSHALRTVDAPALFSLPLLESRLSRHIPLRVLWPGGSTLGCGGSLMTALLHRPQLNLRALDCTAASPRDQTDGVRPVNWWVRNQYARLLKRPALLRLRHLRIAYPIDEATLRLISALPELELLSIALAKPPAYSQSQALHGLNDDQSAALSWSSFHRLHTLIFDRTRNIDARLAELQSMPRLKRVVIQPAWMTDALPSAPSVLRLLGEMPRLRCFLVDSELAQYHLRSAITELIVEEKLHRMSDKSAILRSDDGAGMALPFDSA